MPHDDDAAIVDADTKDDWLRHKTEAYHRRVVTVNEGLQLTPSLYFGTRRCTYSDVVSVVTTVRPLPRHVPEPRVATSASATASAATNSKILDSGLEPATGHAHLTPSKQTQPREAERSSLTQMDIGEYFQGPLEGDVERRRRFLERQAFALAQERTVFMEQLQARRQRRHDQEQRAALAIQRLHRGYLLRKRFLGMKEKLRVRKRIRVNLVKVTKGTAIITGEKERRARIQGERDIAARKIQCVFRRWCSRRLMVRERHVQAQEWRLRLIVRIQRQWRRCLAAACVRKIERRAYEERCQTLARYLSRLFLGYRARQRVHRIRLHRQLIASQRIQSFCKLVQARRAQVLQRRRRRDERRHRAAVAIQRLARGVLARTFVWRLRLREDLEIRVACALQIQRVFRGSRGRRRARFERVFVIFSRAWICATHLTRIVRGFLARAEAELLRLEQETDVLVQTTKGNTSTVIDLLDGYGIVDEPVDMTVVNIATGNNMLHLAARHGRMEIVTHVLPKFLEMAPDMIYTPNKKGETPLDLAIVHEHEQLASFLLTKTAELFGQAQLQHHAGSRGHRRQGTDRERSIILDAARHGMGAIVHKLIMLFPQHFNGKERDSWSKRTVLHEALLLPRDRYQSFTTTSIRGELVLTTLSTLLSKTPTDVNAQDLVGFTPLHLAAFLGNLKAVTLLLEAGADLTIQDAQGRTAWRIALLQGHEPCFLEIRRRWLDNVSSSPALASGAALSLNLDLDQDQTLGKALTDAATKGRPSETGAAIDMHPQLVSTVLQVCRSGQVDRIEFFVHEFWVPINSCDPGGDGDSLLMVALAANQVRVVRYLLEFGPALDFDYVNRAGRSVMDFALHNPNLTALLIREGHVNPTIPMDSTKSHRTACHEAVRRGYNLRKWLHGYVVMPRMFLPLADDTGRTPLHDAAAFANVAAARALLNMGLRADARDHIDQRTPLHEACKSGNLAIVRAMIEACPDALWVTDASGRLPIFDTISPGPVDCLKLVVEQMKKHATSQSQALEALGQLLASTSTTQAPAAPDSPEAFEFLRASLGVAATDT